MAKGRPVDGDNSFIANDFDSKGEPQGWDRLSPENWGKTFKKSIGMGPNERIARDAFADGQKLLSEKKYDAAAKKFGKAADRWPDSALEEDAMFLEAESYFFADRYSKADDEYGELLKKYPNTRYLNKSTARQFSIARYWQDMDKAHPHWR